MSDNNPEYFGQQQASTDRGEFNAISFLVDQRLVNMQTVTLVIVVAVSNAGGVSPVGTVDVQPLIAQMTGDRKPVSHGVIYGIPYFRLQGGSDAIILDPKVGDIGMCAFASRDISIVKSTKAAASPGSWRKFDFADGLYFGGLLNGTPSQYIQFAAGGITITSPTQITLTAPAVQINSTVTVSGDLTALGTSVHTHKHGGVTPGGGQTGVPV